MGMHKGLIGKSEGGGSVKPTYEDKTLGDYIARKVRQDAFDQVAQENKLTFEEWYKKFPKLDIKELEKARYIKYKSIWEAAQENK